MKNKKARKSRRSNRRGGGPHPQAVRVRHKRRPHPAVAYRQRGRGTATQSEAFNAPEVWHEPADRDEPAGRDEIRFVVQPAGPGYIHPVAIDDIRERVELLPAPYTQGLETVQLSPMTKKRALFPCYGMQWGSTVYLYPIEESLTESYVRPPLPQQLIEAEMYGGTWTQEGHLWQLNWTIDSIRDFYLNNVLIHEIGHINDVRNTNFDARERYADWFAIEYGYRASRGRR